MIKVGDKVICIDADDTGYLKSLELGKVYQVNNVVHTFGEAFLSIDHILYKYKRFITIEENRRLKIEKICSKLEIE
jgi:hypothetical protein